MDDALSCAWSRFSAACPEQVLCLWCSLCLLLVCWEYLAILAVWEGRHKQRARCDYLVWRDLAHSAKWDRNCTLQTWRAAEPMPCCFGGRPRQFLIPRPEHVQIYWEGVLHAGPKRDPADRNSEQLRDTRFRDGGTCQSAYPFEIWNYGVRGDGTASLFQISGAPMRGCAAASPSVLA